MLAQAKFDEDIPPQLGEWRACWRVISAKPLPEWRVSVRFVDGLAGELEMRDFIHAPDAGVFAALRDPEVFAAVHVEFGAVTWPGELDLAPDAMYDEIKANGRWVL